MTAPAIQPPPPLINQAPARPLNFGNITYTKSDNTKVTKGIQVVLLDQQGNPMSLPEGWTLPPQLIAQCNQIAQDLIQEMTQNTAGLSDQTLMGFDRGGVHAALPNNTTPPNQYNYTHRAPNMWAAFERAIMLHFNPQIRPQLQLQARPIDPANTFGFNVQQPI